MNMNELDSRAAAYFALQAQIEQLQQEAEAIKDSLKAVMVERATEELEGNGWRATWHNTANSRFDTRRFKVDNPDLYGMYTVKTTGVRFTLNAITA